MLSSRLALDIGLHMNNISNTRKQAFADVVSIEAWHEKFSDDCAVVDLYAHVVFGEAPVGGEEASPVRFRLSVRRAEVVVVVIPETEQLSVDRNSVSGDAPSYEAKTTKTTEKTKSAGFEGKLKGNTSGASVGLLMDAQIGGDIKTQERTEVNQTFGPMLVTQSMTREGYYKWELRSQAGSRLEGAGWDRGKPRLKLLDERKRPLKKSSIPPAVSVEVRCRREDLIITDSQIKDEALHEKLISHLVPRNRLAAAEAYIRDQLMKTGLEVGDLSELFRQITLGSTTAMS